jgi:hypothetical protein
MAASNQSGPFDAGVIANTCGMAVSRALTAPARGSALCARAAGRRGARRGPR